MPICPEYKCLFIHIPKCAGTSIERWLGTYGQRKYLHGYSEPHRIWLQHATYEELERFRLVSRWRLKRWFTFAIVRNPFDRLVSEYHFRKKNAVIPQDMSFDAFVGECEAMLASLPRDESVHLRPQSEFVHAGGKRVDYIGKFESLAHDLENVRHILRIPNAFPVEKFNDTVHRHYREYYSDGSRAFVEHKYAEDLRTFDYRF